MSFLPKKFRPKSTMYELENEKNIRLQEEYDAMKREMETLRTQSIKKEYLLAQVDATIEDTITEINSEMVCRLL